MKKSLLLLILLLSATSDAAPILNLSLGDSQDLLDVAPKTLANTVGIVIALTALALAPSLLFMCTSFLRLVVVFSFMRQAMGTQQMPPNSILISLALVLTFFIMQPAASKAYEDGVKPYMQELIGYDEAYEKIISPFKAFMLKNTRQKDLALFYRIKDAPNPNDASSISLDVLLPAFMISELKSAFQIGFLLYLPFLVIDMVVASVLMAMGMMMLPPVMISLPFKILVFVLVDGWNLLVKNLVASFA